MDREFKIFKIAGIEFEAQRLKGYKLRPEFHLASDRSYLSFNGLGIWVRIFRKVAK